MKKRWKKSLGYLLMVLACMLGFSGCGADITVSEELQDILISYMEKGLEDIFADTYTFDPENIPEYNGEPYVVINDNIPDFVREDLTETSFEYYSPLDSLGRCGGAFANIGQDVMPTEERGSIGMVKPSGWHTVKYDTVNGKYLYNRCHLIGYQLSGENATEENLITGTRYLNMEGMLPFENLVAKYVEETGNHVLYRATPVFEGDDLLAKGVLLEALSVEDEGEDIMFHVFCFNVQPGIEIDYSDGSSRQQEE